MKNFINRIKRKLKQYTLSAQERRHALVGPAKLWKMKQNFQIQFLKDMGLKPEHTLLDVGCGTLRGGIPIIAYLQATNYTGIDVRESVLDEGKKELKESKLENKNPRLVAFEDFANLNLNKKYDFIFAFSVMIHMTDEISAACFEFVSRHLSKNGTFYVNVNPNSREDSEWQGFPVVFRELTFYKELCAKNNLKLKSLGAIKGLGHVSNIPRQDSQIMLAVTKLP